MKIAFLAPLLSLIAATLAAPLDASSLPTDLNNLVSNVNNLSNSIAALPSTENNAFLADALAVHSNALAVSSSLTQTTTVMKAIQGALSEAIQSLFLDAVKQIGPPITASLNGIVENKAAIKASPVGNLGALVKQDIATLFSDTVAFDAASHPILSGSILTQVEALEVAIENQISAAQKDFEAS